MIPENDLAYLRACFPAHTISLDGGMICVVIPGFPVPAGLSVQSTDLLLRLSTGYPDIPPDMWWFSPAVCRPNGPAIPQTQVSEIYLGRQWQRWSRHIAPGQWRSGVDSIESYLALVRKELDAGAGKIAA
jgi:hypothetical protein